MTVHVRTVQRNDATIRAVLRKLLVWLVIGEAALFLVRQPYRPVLVVGESMLPTLHNLQLVIAKPVDYEAHRGDVVVCDWANETIVKRVAGLANDRGLPGMEPWMSVPSGQVYVLGDNPSRSADSRLFGPLYEQDVRMVVVYPPVNKISL